MLFTSCSVFLLQNNAMQNVWQGISILTGGCIIWYVTVLFVPHSPQMNQYLHATHTVNISKHVTVKSGWVLYLWSYWTSCISYVCTGLLLGQWQDTQMDGFPIKFSEAVFLGSSLALSGICYYLYRKSRTTLDKLDVSCWLCVMNTILHFLFSCCLSHRKEWN